jgi:hypothetical protein
MNLQQAAQILKNAGLYAKIYDNYILGGGWIDESSIIRMVYDSFVIISDPAGYSVDIARLNLKDPIIMDLDKCVDLVIKTIPPGNNIPAPPLKPGVQQY